MSAVQNNEVFAFPKTRLRGDKVGAEVPRPVEEGR